MTFTKFMTCLPVLWNHKSHCDPDFTFYVINVKNELFRIPPNVFFPCSPYPKAHKNANDFQIKQQQPEKTFFEVRAKLGSVSFLLDQKKSQSSMNFQISVSSLVCARFK